MLGPLRNTKWIRHEICPLGTYSLPGDIRKRNKIEGLRALKDVQKQCSTRSQEKLILAQKIMENFIKMKFMFHMTYKWNLDTWTEQRFLVQGHKDPGRFWVQWAGKELPKIGWLSPAKETAATQPWRCVCVYAHRCGREWDRTEKEKTRMRLPELRIRKYFQARVLKIYIKQKKKKKHKTEKWPMLITWHTS